MTKMTKYYLAFGLITLAVGGLVVYGFSVIGTPSQQQAAKYDSTRISNMSSLSYSIQSYYLSHSKLPTALTDLSYSSNYKDPQTGAPYTYTTSSDTSYKLCATFSEDSSKEKNNPNDDYFGLYSDESTPSTSHKKGYDCITYNIPASYIKSSTSNQNNYNLNNSSTTYSVSNLTVPAKIKQGGSNMIKWEGNTEVDIILLSTSNMATVGYITAYEKTKGQNYYAWDGETLYSTYALTTKVTVTPGNYYIRISPSGGTAVTSSQITIEK